MEKPRRIYDDQFAWAMSFFGTSLLRQARQKAISLPPAVEGEHPDTPLSKAAGEAFDRLLEHVYALPKDEQVEACVMIAHGMIMEHLRLASRMPKA